MDYALYLPIKLLGAEKFLKVFFSLLLEQKVSWFHFIIFRIKNILGYKDSKFLIKYMQQKSNRSNLLAPMKNACSMKNPWRFIWELDYNFFYGDTIKQIGRLMQKLQQCNRNSKELSSTGVNLSHKPLCLRIHLNAKLYCQHLGTLFICCKNHALKVKVDVRCASTAQNKKPSAFGDIHQQSRRASRKVT